MDVEVLKLGKEFSFGKTLNSIFLGKCIYERPMTVDWTLCRNTNDLRYKNLKLIKNRDKKFQCPAMKVMSKTCKNNAGSKLSIGKKSGK